MVHASSLGSYRIVDLNTSLSPSLPRSPSPSPWPPSIFSISHYCAEISAHALCGIISPRSIILFSFFHLSIIVTLPTSTVLLLSGSHDWHRLCFFLGTNLFQGSIYQAVVVLTPPPPSHVVFCSPRNHLDQYLSCIIHFNYVLVIVNIFIALFDMHFS